MNKGFLCCLCNSLSKGDATVHVANDGNRNEKGSLFGCLNLYFGVSKGTTFCDNGIYERPAIDL